MESTNHNPECDAFRDDLATLATGALTGLDRARVLAHLEECPHCTGEVEELAAAADALYTLVPDATPPAGFSDRTMERIRADRQVPRRPAIRRLATVAAMVVLVAAGAGLGVAVSSSVHSAPATAVRTTSLHSSVGTKGTVLLVSSDSQGWLVMDLRDAPTSGVVTCSITLADGSRKDLGRFVLTGGYGSWSATLPVPASSVRTVSVTDTAGMTVASGRVT